MLRKGTLSLMVLAVVALATVPGAAAEVRTYGNIIGELIPIVGDEGNAPKAAIDLDIRFEINSARLSTEATHQLDELGKALTAPQLTDAKIEVNGHTDASGDAIYNKKLSRKRAEAVRNYLIEVYRINPRRLTAIGWGEERLKNTVQPKAAENRRVEIVNLTPPKPPAAPTPPPPAKATTSVPMQQSVPMQPSVQEQPSLPMQPAPTPPAPTESEGGLQAIN